MENYRLSVYAVENLGDIYIHGVEQFGESRADTYYDDLFRQFCSIADAPYRYPAVDHIRMGYRRCVHGIHSIYYRLNDAGTVEIMAILGRQDADSVL